VSVAVADYRVVCGTRTDHIVGVSTAPDEFVDQRLWTMKGLHAALDRGDTFHMLNGTAQRIEIEKCPCAKCGDPTIRSAGGGPVDEVDRLPPCIGPSHPSVT
jgi:hypothetical protein